MAASLSHQFFCFFTIFVVCLRGFARGDCQSSGTLPGNGDHDCKECCKAGEQYPIYYCSPDVSGGTPAILTLNDFGEGGDGGDPSECDNSFHSNEERIVALSSGWYNGGSRCLKEITIYGNGRSTTAKVVDECDSKLGCDEEHAYQPPCRNNIVDGSQAVWDALGASGGDLSITWSE